MRRVFDAARGTYGCRRVAAALNREGIACSVGLVADLMRELGLRACQPRAYKRTTVPGEQPVDEPGSDRAGLHRARRRGPGWSGTSPNGRAGRRPVPMGGWRGSPEILTDPGLREGGW